MLSEQVAFDSFPPRNNESYCENKSFHFHLIWVSPSNCHTQTVFSRRLPPSITLYNCWDPSLRAHTHTSRPRERVQWMWYGTPPACTHPLLRGGEGRTQGVREGRERAWEGGREGRGGVTHITALGEGTPPSCPIFFTPFLLTSSHCSSYMSACVCICACVCARPEHMPVCQTCDQQPQPPF